MKSSTRIGIGYTAPANNKEVSLPSQSHQEGESAQILGIYRTSNPNSEYIPACNLFRNDGYNS